VEAKCFKSAATMLPNPLCSQPFFQCSLHHSSFTFTLVTHFDNSDKLQDSASFVDLSLFMMGKSLDRTKPVVMFVSDDKAARVEAFRLIKNSSIRYFDRLKYRGVLFTEDRRSWVPFQDGVFLSEALNLIENMLDENTVYSTLWGKRCLVQEKEPCQKCWAAACYKDRRAKARKMSCGPQISAYSALLQQSMKSLLSLAPSGQGNYLLPGGHPWLWARSAIFLYFRVPCGIWLANRNSGLFSCPIICPTSS